MESIKDNLAKINQRIINAAQRSNRNPADIQLVAVSKRVPIERIQEAADNGQHLFGENYTQEAAQKISRFGKQFSWHFIGHLQSNKAKIAAELFQVIETVDSLKLAKALNNHLVKTGKSISIFIQINIGGESRKSGVMPEDTEKLLTEVNKLPNINVKGLMTIPPYLPDPEQVRPFFRQMRKLLSDFHDKNLLGQCGSPELSMGMSGDFEIAIEEGATLVRVGTAIFGERNRRIGI